MIFSKDYVRYLARQTVKHLVAEKMINTEKPAVVNERVAAAMREAAPDVRAEPGCLGIEYFRSTRDPALFYIHSRWRDEAAFEVHAALPHTLRFLERVEPGVQGAVVEVKNVAERGKAENPVMAFYVSEHSLDRVTDKGDRAQQIVHRTPPLTGIDPPIANRIGPDGRSFPLSCYFDGRNLT